MIKYFLGISIAHNPSGIYPCQRKYTLEIIFETGLMGAINSFEQNHQLAKSSSVSLICQIVIKS